MKLNCEVEVANRGWSAVPNRIIKGRFKRSIITIGGKNSNLDEELYIVLLTTQNAKGTKYKIKGNIENVFNKFANEGKSTIRLKEPTHDLIIKNADPVQLKGFLSVLSLAMKGKPLKTLFLSQPPLKIEPIKTRLSVISRKDYPQSFPPTLKLLTISNIKLLRVPVAITLLAHLECLDLSNNSIEAVSLNLFQMKSLRCLNISSNSLVLLIEDIPQNEITILNLKDNKLLSLPESLANMSNLKQLNLDHNKLTTLPESIGQLKRLKILTASVNQIRALPGSFVKLRGMEYLDFAENPLGLHFENPTSFNINVELSLLNLAASTVLRKCLKYGPSDLPHTLMKYLENAKMCVCRKFICNSGTSNTGVINLGDHASAVMGNKLACVEINICSNRCWT